MPKRRSTYGKPLPLTRRCAGPPRKSREQLHRERLARLANELPHLPTLENRHTLQPCRK
jgi:hypothetical protein